MSRAVHVHTTYSDGTATVEEIAADAAAAGVDVVLLTDHDSLAARRDGWEGRHDGVFVLVGTEVSRSRATTSPSAWTGRSRTPGGRRARSRRRCGRPEGVGFAAHPFSRGGHMLAPALARRIVLATRLAGPRRSARLRRHRAVEPHDGRR